MNLTERLIREIVKQALVEAGQAKASCCSDFVKIKDPSGIIKVATDTVKCERFEQDGVALKDVLTLEEAPRMGCGIMELDHTSFEWTLTYDEYDIVLDGELEIESTVVYFPQNKARLFTFQRTATFISRLRPQQNMFM